ncbi:MAG: ribokinase [Leadbetterella sp.]
MSQKLFIVGSSNTDMVIKSAKLPLPGETILGGDFYMNPGGKGANQAAAAGKLINNVVFVSKVGNDVFGSQAIDSMKKIGVNTEKMIVDSNQASGIALILVDEKGENSISVASGANAALTAAEVVEAISNINSSDILLTQLETPLPTVIEAVKYAKAKNALVVLNPAPAQTLPEDIYPHLDLITPNETEAKILTGIDIEGLDSAKAASNILLSLGCKAVLITLGEKGSFYKDKDKEDHIKSFKVEAKDTTAAGDVFNGALCVSLLNGLVIQDAIVQASAAAAISVTRLGAQSSAPSLDEVRNFINSFQ